MTEKGLRSHSVYNIMSITIRDDMRVSDGVEDKRLKGGERRSRPHRLNKGGRPPQTVGGTDPAAHPPRVRPFWVEGLREWWERRSETTEILCVGGAAWMFIIFLVFLGLTRTVVVSCPKCDSVTRRGGYAAWQILASILLFPIGLVALAGGRQPTKCILCDLSLAGLAVLL